MTDQPMPRRRLADYSVAYTDTRSRAARHVERAALGHEVGLSGYTTVNQAQTLCDHVALGPTSVLLDIGAGRGWPGSHVADAHGCHLVSTDVPWSALRAIRGAGTTDTSSPRRDAVAADGRGLPFVATSFDAIVHADVFC